MSKQILNIALLDPHRIFRDGLETLLLTHENLSLVGSVATPPDLVSCLTTRKVDVAILELVNAGTDLLRQLEEWTKAHPDVRFLVLSQLPEVTYAGRALSVGASGYLTKEISFAELVAAIWKVANGDVALSPAMTAALLANFTRRTKISQAVTVDQLSNRELHVLTLMGQGRTNTEIASSMGISPKTVSTYKERIKEKLGLCNGAQLTQASLHWMGTFQEVNDAKTEAAG